MSRSLPLAHQCWGGLCRGETSKLGGVAKSSAPRLAFAGEALNPALDQRAAAPLWTPSARFPTASSGAYGSSKLQVGNFDCSVTHEQLEELFSTFGEVRHVKISEGGGVGFVQLGRSY